MPPTHQNPPPTIAWPPATSLTGRIEPEIDELNIDVQPFEGYGQALTAARIHLDIALNAAPDPSDPDVAPQVAFENAVRAKHCLHYARLEHDDYPPSDYENTLLASADRLLVKNHRPDARRPHDGRQRHEQDRALAITEARAHAGALADVIALMESKPDPDETPQEVIQEWHTGLVRMAAYLADPPRGRGTPFREGETYRQVMSQLVAEVNKIIFANEHLIKTDIGCQAAAHPDEPYDLLDELYGTEGFETTFHDCGPSCLPEEDPHLRNQGHEIIFAFMHNGVRFVRAATEPMPQEYPQKAALCLIDALRQELDAIQEEAPEYEYRHFWHDLHDLQAAASVGVHAIYPLDLETIHDDLMPDLPRPGIVQYLLHSATMENLHAVRFLTSAVIPTARFAPTDQQVEAVIEAARANGMDGHQVAFLAAAMYRDPAMVGSGRPQPDERAIEEVAQRSIRLPEPNHSYLVHRLKNPS